MSRLRFACRTAIISVTDINSPNPSDTLPDLIARVRTAFVQRFHRPPTQIVAAPGRVNLIGEHIDYSDGFVLPMAIERYVVIAADRRDTDDSDPAANDRDPDANSARLFSLGLQDERHVPIAGLTAPTEQTWSNYVAGVIAGFTDRGVTIPAFDAVVDSTVPMGGGLSSSAALEVATATLLESLTVATLPLVDKALLCQRAEHRFAGVPCGIMDQFSSVFGQPNALMLLDCRSREIESVPFTSSEISVLITNSNVRHELTGGEYAQRRQQCESSLAKLGQASWRDVTLTDVNAQRDQLTDIEFRRARHVVTEIARTQDAAAALARGDYTAFGHFMYDSHQSLRDDYEVSCAELDILVELARAIGPAGGVLGSRMTGGGFGGCTVSFVRTAQVASVSETLSRGYLARTGIESTLFATRPARGAHVIEVAS